MNTTLSLIDTPAVEKFDIEASSYLDDLIFMSEPNSWSYEEQKNIRHDVIMKAFRWHYQNNADYRRYCQTIGIGLEIEHLDDIPVYPTSVFKTMRVTSAKPQDIEHWFTSSGTQGQKSYIPRDRLSIERLLGSVSYGMKLVGTWFDHEMELVNLGPDRFNAHNIWFKYVMSLVELLYPTAFTAKDDRVDFEQTLTHLYRIQSLGKTACLIGPPYFIYLLCQHMKAEKIHFRAGHKLYIITGGGWKTHQNSALNRDQFNQLLMETFGLNDISQIRDTFNQVELNTCFFEDDQQRKCVPPWVYARALNPRTLQPLSDGKIGLMSYMDASATSYPAFLITDDLGYVHQPTEEIPYTRVQIVRRINTRAQKGCALKMSQHFSLPHITP
ncbi:long-chain fatty acid--CoA ligase [Vibrio cholerae]|nr:long-chain fatty acid--CoA ligase [Vibrio cholerae]